MTPSPIGQTIQGALVMGCFVVGLFFLRYWRRAHDRLFAMFALAFWVLGADWLGLAVLATEDEVRTVFYLVRLAAFVLILLAIADKNRAARRVASDVVPPPPGRPAGRRTMPSPSCPRPGRHAALAPATAPRRRLDGRAVATFDPSPVSISREVSWS